MRAGCAGVSTHGIELAPLMNMRSTNIIEILETEFGVPRAFTEPLIPVLERAAGSQASAREWAALLGGVAEAYRAAQAASTTHSGSQSPGADEVAQLMERFSSELQKLDDSLKVLTVSLERVCQTLDPSVPRPTIH